MDDPGGQGGQNPWDGVPPDSGAGSALFAWLGSADRDGDGSTTRAGDLSAIELRVGDCFDAPGMHEEVEGGAGAHVFASAILM